jgi:hypothetical protein
MMAKRQAGLNKRISHMNKVVCHHYLDTQTGNTKWEIAKEVG